jgi:hypothetical protein
MRTTLTLDDNLAKAVEKFQKKKNMSLKECVNHLLQAGLQAVEKTSSQSPYEGPVFDSELQPGIDPNRMNQLADELECEEAVSS